MLHGAGYRKPTAVHVHGFLTVDGQKMSKSRGTFITAKRYLERLPPEPLRYYFAAKLGNGLDDIDLNLADFVARVNSDIVGKLVNIASRCAGFVARSGGVLAPKLPDEALYQAFLAESEMIAGLYDSRDYSAAMRELMALADRANQYVDHHKPWVLAKDPTRAAEALAIATQGVNLFRVLITWLSPVLPAIAEKAAAFLGSPVDRWDSVREPLLGRPIKAYEPLATRLERATVEALVQPAAAAAAPAKAAESPATIQIQDFAKLDLRVARVVNASTVEGSDKLLKLELDVGDHTRTVFSGIRSAYAPDQLVGRHVVLVANLAPRKMRFGTSEGMVLCASGKDDAEGLYLLSPDSGAVPGMKVT